MTLPQGKTVQYGDVAMLVGKDRKPFIRTIRKGEVVQTHFGQIDHDALVGMLYGEQFHTPPGHSLYVLAPSLDDFLTYFERTTQIIYPKDLGYIGLKLGLRQGMTAVECGTGSGALTALLALLVGDEGHVYTYERRNKSMRQAMLNLKRIGLDHRVTFVERDLAHGFDQTDADAVFLDLPNPYDYLEIARRAVHSGGFFGAIVPTVNQLILLLEKLYQGPWFLLQAEEILQRRWKTIPARVRPDEDMYGHTGILVFARAVQRETRYPISKDDFVDDSERPSID